MNLTESSIESLSSSFEKHIELSLSIRNPVSRLLCGYGGPGQSVFSRGELSEDDHGDNELKNELTTAAAVRRKAAALDKLSAESVLANCARQKKLMAEDLRSLQRVFWTRSRKLWEQTAETAADNVTNSNKDNQQQQQNGSAYVKLSFTKANKLLGEVDRARQQEADVQSTEAARCASKPKPKRDPNVRPARRTLFPHQVAQTPLLQLIHRS